MYFDLRFDLGWLRVMRWGLVCVIDFILVRLGVGMVALGLV